MKLTQPWLSIWTQPRKTMRAILSKDPNKWIHTLSIVSGILFAIAMKSAWAFTVPDDLPLKTLLLTTAIGAVGGGIYLYLGALIYRWVGSWLGGKGNYTEVKSAVGWSNYPFLLPHLFFILSGYAPLSVFHYITNFLFALSAIWSLIIFIKLLAEAHRFSAWKAFFAFLFVFTVVAIIMLIPFSQ